MRSEVDSLGEEPLKRVDVPRKGEPITTFSTERKHAFSLSLPELLRATVFLRFSVPSPDSELFSTLKDVLAPLIEADGGELYILGEPAIGGGADPGSIRLHLGGRFAGCPGNSLVSEHIIRPTLALVAGPREIQVSSGRLIPPGAERIRPGSPGST